MLYGRKKISHETFMKRLFGMTFCKWKEEIPKDL